MKSMFFLALLAPVTIAAQEPGSDSTRFGCLEVTFSYDRIENHTIAATEDDIVPGTTVLVSARMIAPGKNLTAARDAFLFFGSYNDTWEYLEYHPIVLLLDGVTRMRPQTEHKGDVRSSGGVREDVIAILTPAQLVTLGAARKVEGKVGTTAFELSPRQIAAIRELARQAKLSAPQDVRACARPTESGWKSEIK